MGSFKNPVLQWRIGRKHANNSVVRLAGFMLAFVGVVGKFRCLILNESDQKIKNEYLMYRQSLTQAATVVVSRRAEVFPCQPLLDKDGVMNPPRRRYIFA